MRRPSTILIAIALMLAGAACGDDDGDDADASASADVTQAETDGADEVVDGEDEPGEAGGAPVAGGPSGRLEIDGEDHNFWLGDSATAQCSTSDGGVTVQDLRAADGRSVAVALNEVGAVIWEATLRDPDGNREWFTGNTGDAEGLDASYTIADNVVMVSGEWARADDPSSTTEGTLVVTC